MCPRTPKFNARAAFNDDWQEMIPHFLAGAQGMRHGMTPAIQLAFLPPSLDARIASCLSVWLSPRLVGVRWWQPAAARHAHHLRPHLRSSRGRFGLRVDHGVDGVDFNQGVAHCPKKEGSYVYLGVVAKCNPGGCRFAQLVGDCMFE